MNGHPDPDSPDQDDSGRETRAPFDLVVADASWTWTEKLFTPLAELGVRVLLIKACDWRNAIHQRRPASDWLCPQTRQSENLWQQQFVLPPGWMKTYPNLGMKPLAWAARAWHNTLPSPRPLALAISYPHYLYLRDLLRPDSLLYYNMDDYAFYWASRQKTIRDLERQTVRQADLSVFCAQIRAHEMTEMEPEAAERIIHLPHGAPRESIVAFPQHTPALCPPDLAALPGPRLGFVGSLEDRLDWNLVGNVADRFSTGSVVLIGREPRACPGEEWYAHYRAAVARPNVHRLGWKTQSEIARYNAAFDVCMIPYRVDHPFNRVSCPTKVMDYMATTRPVVSTAVPECCLYSDLFHVAETTDEFLSAVAGVVNSGSDDGRAEMRWNAAKASTWQNTASKLLAEFRDRLASTNRSGETLVSRAKA